MMEDGSLRMQSTGPKKGSEVWYVFQRTEAWDDIGFSAIPRRLWALTAPETRPQRASAG